MSLGGPDEPKKVLRKFERLHLAPSQQVVWSTTLSRRDLSNWDVQKQDWVITPYHKEIFVGSSSRQLPLHASLPAVQ